MRILTSINNLQIIPNQHKVELIQIFLQAIQQLYRTTQGLWTKPVGMQLRNALQV